METWYYNLHNLNQDIFQRKIAFKMSAVFWYCNTWCVYYNSDYTVRNIVPVDGFIPVTNN